MRGLRGRRPRGRPRKTLAELVREGSFLARRHDGLLAGDDVEDPTLAALQALYQQEGMIAAAAVALRSEKICRAVPPAAVGGPDVAPDVEPVVEFDVPLDAAESYAEMMARIWRQPAPWRECGIDPADGHRHSGRERSTRCRTATGR